MISWKKFSIFFYCIAQTFQVWMAFRFRACTLPISFYRNSDKFEHEFTSFDDFFFVIISWIFKDFTNLNFLLSLKLHFPRYKIILYFNYPYSISQNSRFKLTKIYFLSTKVSLSKSCLFNLIIWLNYFLLQFLSNFTKVLVLEHELKFTSFPVRYPPIFENKIKLPLSKP